MSDSPLISVIVPVYNTEQYLRKCLDSICGQTYRNLEILCVDDGSTDESAAILREYAAKDYRVKVLSQPNSGLSAARNLALDNATGEWITGVDSDDYMEPDAYEYVLAAIEDEVDIVCFGTNIVWVNLEPEKHLIPFFEYSYDGKCKVTPAVINNTNDSFWNKLWRRSLIEQLKLRFPKGLWYEDSYFWRASSAFARNIYYLNEKKINYVRHGESIMSKVFRKHEKTMDRVLIADALMKFYNEHPLPEVLRTVQIDAFLFCFSTALADVPCELHTRVWDGMRRIAFQYDLLSRWADRLAFLKPVPLLLRPFVYHYGPGKSSYGIPGFRPLVIQRKNGLKIVRFLGIKLSCKSL